MTTTRSAVLAALALSAGCTIIVPGDLGRISCEAEGAIGPPACEQGQFCGGGMCRLCVENETCDDRMDNDCDGQVDEACADAGLGGTGAGGGGGMSAAGGMSSGGSAGMATGGASGVGGTGGVGPGGSPAGGAAGAAGVAGGPPGPGEPCGPAGGCDTGLFCLDPSTVGGSGAAFCTRGCCTSMDCGNGAAVCWPGPNSTSICRLAASVGRPPPGAGITGVQCSSNGDCRSGACEGGRCIDTCCDDGDCSSIDAPDCTFRDYDGAMGFQCGDSGSEGYGSLCNGDGECRSNECIPQGFTGFCSEHCCSSRDCSALMFVGDVECRYRARNGAFIRVCDPGPAGPKGVGEACTSDDECQGGRCLDLGGALGRICTDACCTDADCGDPGTYGCRQVLSSGEYVLRCVPL